MPTSNVTGGPRAVAPLFPVLDPTPINKREFDSDVLAMRAQIDF